MENRKIMVLFCITDLNKGGAEKSLVNICLNTNKTYPDFCPVVFSLIGGYYGRVLKDAGIVCFTLIETNAVLAILRNLYRMFSYANTNRKNIRVIHGFMPYGCIFGLLYKLILWKPLIYAIRNSVLAGGGHDSIIRRSFRKFSHWLSIQTAQCITVNSPHVETIITKKYKKKVQIVMNGIEVPQGSVSRDPMINKEYFSDNKIFNVVCVCNMRYPQKDIPGLLQVAALDRSIGFIIVGDGPDLKWFMNIAAEKELKNVKFAGYHENVSSFLNLASAFITLSRHEGFPNTVLEAMMCRCPVIFSNIPEVNGVLLHEKNALLVKNGDPYDVLNAIRKLRDDTMLRHYIIEEGYKMVTTEFNMHSFIRKNYATYVGLNQDSAN